MYATHTREIKAAIDAEKQAAVKKTDRLASRLLELHVGIDSVINTMGSIEETAKWGLVEDDYERIG